MSSQWRSWAFRSSRFWNERARKKSSRMAVRPLDLALGLGPVGAAGPGVEAVVAGEVDQRPVVDDVALGILAQDRGLHPVAEDLARHALERGKGGEVAAQHALQVLVQDEAGPRAGGCSRAPGRTARRSGSPPARRRTPPGIGRSRPAPGRRAASRSGLQRRGLPAAAGRGRIRDGGVAAPVATLLQLPKKAPASQARPGLDPLTQVGDERVDAPGARRPRTIDRHLQPAREYLRTVLQIPS